MTPVVDWKRAPSGIGEDGYFALGVFQVRRAFRAIDRTHIYKIHFLPYAQFKDVTEDDADTQERETFLGREWERFSQTKCVAIGIAIGLLERVRKPEQVNDPIVTAIENALKARAPAKMTKAELLSLTGLNEGQWTHFLLRRPSTIQLESHGRGARYWYVWPTGRRVGDADHSATTEPPRSSPEYISSDTPPSPRPEIPKARFRDFVGQPQVQERLEKFISAAKERNEPLDHVLLAGPPGLGKSTLAEIIAGELGRPLHVLMAPSLNSAMLQDAMENVLNGEIVFVDEIHRLNQQQQEQLFSFMKKKITVIAATNFPASLLPSLRDRFSITEDLRLYQEDELVRIINHASDSPISPKVAAEIAKRSRGTPRTALALLRRLRDLNGLTEETVEAAFKTLQVDPLGLTPRDRDYLEVLARASGPVGLDSIASTLNEKSPDTIKQVIEPFLLQQGFIEQTKTGRIITEKGRQHIAPLKGRRGRAPGKQSKQEDLGL